MCKPRQCQWCSAEFTSDHPTKMFCTKTCKTDFNNFMTVFGKRLAPVALTWRSQRGRKGAGADAMKEMCRMLDKAYGEYKGGKDEGRVAQPIEKHYVKCRASGVGVTLRSER